MKELLRRMSNILLHPNTEWHAIRDERTTYPEIILRYVGILSVIPPAAAVAGRYIFEGNIPDGVLLSSPSYLLLSNVLWYCMYIMNVVVTGWVITAIMVTVDSRRRSLKGLQLAAYSFTPLFIAGLVAVIPHMRWCISLALLYGMYILYLGMRALLGMRGMKAALYTAAAATAAGVVVGTTNLFEYVLESLIMKKILL